MLEKLRLSNKLRRLNVRYEEELGQKKLRKYQQWKVERSRTNYSMELLKEKQKIRKREVELSKLSNLELKLIAQLKGAEQIQTSALKQFDDTVQIGIIRSVSKSDSNNKVQTQYSSPRYN
eukprot:TRINITY_DN19897_c0_g1_i2.p1 TRINITY_DN19897_c0_g1~~TRINITY_DN19897_c0_g1_i2.p1  ORF type:complete len:120 (-),score=26.46 TRINITY_DN19897_c0_g1_i2:93-452(-)